MTLNISLTPINSPLPTEAELNGTVITLSDPHEYGVTHDFDLSLIGDGDTVTHEILGTVTRTGDTYDLQMLNSIWMDAPEESLNPDTITMTGDGIIPIPPHRSK
jgi:hypothetical protein